MKIKTQSLFLIGGIILIPIITIFCSWLISQQNTRTAYALPSYHEIFGSEQNLNAESDWKKLQRFISRRGDNTQIVILNRDTMEIIYSSISLFPAKSRTDADKLTEYSLKEADRYFFNLTSNNRIITFIGIEKQAFQKHRLTPFSRTVILISSIILLFCIIMMVIISRSIANSVTILENAADRVAKGDLAKPIEVQGSNEIVSLTRSLNELRLAVKENKDRQARFIMGISHDLKTPLALIKGYVEALYDEIPESPEERKKYTEIILRKADDLEILINDLINFIKVDTGEWRTLWKDVNLYDFLTAFGRQISEDGTLLKRHISVDIRLPEDTAVQMDEKLIVRCFENLFSNAVRYTSEGGSIRLSAMRNSENGSYMIRFEDNGIGIENEELNNIFDLFYRGSASRREKGNGLGLAIVKSIITSHNWNISAESQPGKGTAFSIVIPE
ncbi:MAG: HAMP domain-containing histidine kinase [Spirochaetia bacterium]|nr:HAMP domain-containing histidine kinase [Spirochaetia bacterium]